MLPLLRLRRRSARSVGFSDLDSGLTGASLSLGGGFLYSEVGVAAVAFGATVAVALPALLIAFAGHRPLTKALESAG